MQCTPCMLGLVRISSQAEGRPKLPARGPVRCACVGGGKQDCALLRRPCRTKWPLPRRFWSSWAHCSPSCCICHCGGGRRAGSSSSRSAGWDLRCKMCAANGDHKVCRSAALCPVIYGACLSFKGVHAEGLAPPPACSPCLAQDSALRAVALEWANRSDTWSSLPPMKRFSEQLLEAHFPQVHAPGSAVLACQRAVPLGRWEVQP